MSAWTRRGFVKSAILAASGPWVKAASIRRAKEASSLLGTKAERISRLKDVHNFLTTPFHSNYDLDAEGLARNVADHVRNPARDMTLVVGGGLGELFTLDVAEHKEMVAAAVSAAAGVLPVVAGAGGGYRNALRMARNAEQAGAEAVLVFAYPFSCNEAEGAYDYLREVTESVGIGVLIYCCTKGDFWERILPRLAQLPNVIGFKDPSGGLDLGRALGSLLPDNFLWIAEGESHAEMALPQGARAYTTAVATFVPRATREFWAAGISGEVDRMQKIRKARIDPVVGLRSVQPGYGISGIKVALEALGRAGGPVRPPGTPVASQDRATIAAIAREHAERPLSGQDDGQSNGVQY